MAHTNQITIDTKDITFHKHKNVDTKKMKIKRFLKTKYKNMVDAAFYLRLFFKQFIFDSIQFQTKLHL